MDSRGGGSDGSVAKRPARRYNQYDTVDTRKLQTAYSDFRMSD